MHREEALESGAEALPEERQQQLATILDDYLTAVERDLTNYRVRVRWC